MSSATRMMSFARDKSHCADKREIRDETDSEAFMPITGFACFERIESEFQADSRADRPCEAVPAGKRQVIGPSCPDRGFMD